VPNRRIAAAHRVGDHDARSVDTRWEQTTVTLSQSMVEALSCTNSGRSLNLETMYRVRTEDRQPVRRLQVRLEPLLGHLDRYL
jgi:hypothetical protein